jgi:23S rRNA (cytidine1920-2'-O)/16S rRNA (cytidine1409-2'-O)-methyltransferase
MPTRRPLLDLLRARRPELDDPATAIAEGRVRVDGAVISNPRSLVRADASVVTEPPRVLQGVRKLGAALDRFAVDPAGRVALDVGASTGGFTTALLDRRARLVYAVDVGYGQLLGSLRQDPRVRTLERTNVADLRPALLDEPPDLFTVDVSKLSLAAAIAQLTANLAPAPGAELVGLVKPMFELRTAELPTTEEDFAAAVDHAATAAAEHGWQVLGSMRSPVAGHRGAVEHFLHARRTADQPEDHVHTRSRPTGSKPRPRGAIASSPDS